MSSTYPRNGQTRKKVVIIGAGFSAPIGIPVMRGFFSKMWETYRDPTSGLGGNEASLDASKIPDKTWFGEVLSEWQRWQGGRTAQEADDLEAFCSHVSGNRDLRSKALYSVARLFELRMHERGNLGLEGVWGTFYRMFAREVGQACGAITIITLNQDLLPDQALLQEGYLPQYSLPEDWRRIKDVNEQQKIGEPVPLLKIHGSMNWLVCDDPCCPLLHVKWQKEGSPNCPGNWPTGAETHVGHLSPRPLFFLMVLPEREKQSANEKWLTEVWKAAKDSLREADEVFFLGYSAPTTDDDIVELLQANLSKCRHMHVVNTITGTDATCDLMARYNSMSSGRFPITFHLGWKLGDVTQYHDSPWRQALLLA